MNPRKNGLIVTVTSVFLALPAAGFAATTRYVATTGADSGNCSNPAAPCLTIPYGTGKMAGGDTLIVANGAYTTPDAIRNVPSGNPGPDGVPLTADDVYTTVRAQTDFGVLIDGSQWADNYLSGVRLDPGSQFIKIQGFKIYGNQAKGKNSMLALYGAKYIKVIHNLVAYAGAVANVTAIGAGSGSDYVLFEENIAYGGARYMFQAYWADHIVFRRNVARNDYWNGSLQAAAFQNYDSFDTVWQNNIAIDSDMNCCNQSGGSGLYAAYFNENKTDHAPDTSEEFHGNIVLNYKAFYGTHLDDRVTGARIMSNNIWWDSNGGYWGDRNETVVNDSNGIPIPDQGVPASWQVSNITSGMQTGTYDPPNGGGMRGTGFALNFAPHMNWVNSVKNSVFVSNQAFGVAANVNGDYNAFYGNGTPYGGAPSGTPPFPVATPGPNDITTHNILYSGGNPTGSLRYLPQGPEPGSELATAGQNGTPVGARVLWKIGVDGTLYGEPGWNVERSPANGYGGPNDSLWPFPNEAIIKAEFASYNGPGLAGPRGFAAPGNGLYGGPITLTSYIWEYPREPLPGDDLLRRGPAAPGTGEAVQVQVHFLRGKAP